MSQALSPSYSTTFPVIPRAVLPGQLVGLVLQNTGAGLAASSEVTFGQVFKAGAVAAGSQLYATVTGADGGTSEVAVQMDAKTFNADGSVATSVLSFLAPAIAANSSADVMLSVGPALADAAPLDLASALKNYSLTVDLAVQSGTTAAPATTNYHIDAVAAMQAALADGTASFWQSGPNVSQARVIVPVAGSMQMVFDITANANGTFSTDVQFDNDEAWVQNSSGQIVTGTKATDIGGTVTYNETITQNGAVVSQQDNVKQYQYQNWHKVVTTQPSIGQINIQHDVAYLEATGAIQNYDLTTGIPASDIASYVSTMASAPHSGTTSNLGSGYGQPLSANGVDPGMGGTGSRPDIGPTTGVNSDWLMTQNATVAQYALNEADAAGAVPWNIQNGASGLPLTTLGDPNLWVDPRGGPYSGSSGLVQNLNTGNTWNVDTSHQPDLSYDPYLLTGSRYNFDELQQQAAYSVTSQWPAWQQRSRNAASDLIVNGNQVRGAAWELRQVDEAAATALPGSAMQAYFTQVENDNFAWLVSQEAGWTKQQGQAYGWLPGVYGNNGNYGPWEQDFLSIVVAQAAEQGNALAKQFMAWEDNFIVGRFLQAANGFLPQDGIAYTLQFYDPKTGLDYQTWAQIEQVTASYGLSNGPNPNATGWVHSQGYYGQTALAALAGAITVFESPQAIQAYGWLLGSGAPYINGATSGQYSIVPRLSDGNLLTHDNLLISTDAAGTTNTLSLNTNNDQLIHAGAGNDTLKGGAGINLLFAGSGSDVLIGGPNNDYLYGGSGSDSFSAGAGVNYMQAGTGADTFILNQGDAATDTIAGFKIGTDQLDITDASGNALNAASIQTLIATATADPQGNAILHLSPTHSVVLSGIGLAELASTMFISGSGTLPGAVPSGDTLQVTVSEDAWQGDAKFVVTVDGKQVGGVQTVNGASHSAGQTDTVSLNGSFAAGPHDIGISFINDAYGGSSARDRNLYVSGLNYDGVAYNQDSAALYGDNTANFTVGAVQQAANGPMTGPVIGSGPDTLQLLMAEDSWQGDAQFTVSVDGQQVGGVQTVAGALNSQNQAETFTLNGSFGNGPHTVAVSFINDTYGGSSTKDRNLYVKGITYNGQSYGNDKAPLYGDSTVNFAAGATAASTGAPLAGATIGTGPDTLALGISQDAWQGDARFTIQVNGQQVGGVQTVDGGATHTAGAVENFTVNGTFGAGPNTVTVSFINDAYGGSSSMDRNLYVKGLSFDGNVYANDQANLYGDGSASFTVQAPAVAPVTTPPANILTVGASGEYKTLAAAVAAAQNGDTIEVQAGTYYNDVANVSGNITIEGVGGMVNEVSTSEPSNRKGLLDVYGNITISNMSFSGVAVSDNDGGNGAGIRYEGGNLTLNNDYFYNNQDGLLGNADPNGTITINNSEFANNGSGSGYTHNIYIGDIKQATINNSLFTGANVGHEIKSRAQNTTITNSRIIDGPGGTASYSIDTPNGGNVVIQNNVIEKASTAGNPVMITSGEEGAYANSSLTVSGNTFINNYGASAVAVRNNTGSTASITGNQFYGLTVSQIAQGAATISGSTMLGAEPSLDLSAPFSSSQLSVADIASQSNLVTAAISYANTATASSASTTALLGGALSATQQTSASLAMLHAA